VVVAVVRVRRHRDQVQAGDGPPVVSAYAALDQRIGLRYNATHDQHETGSYLRHGDRSCSEMPATCREPPTILATRVTCVDSEL
jgi:hypothetical protein